MQEFVASSIPLIRGLNSALSLSPGILPGDFVAAKFQERLLQPGVQDGGESPRSGLLAAQSGMAPELGPQSTTFVPVYPDEETRVGSRGCAVCHTVSPILGEAVVLRGSR